MVAVAVFRNVYLPNFLPSEEPTGVNVVLNLEYIPGIYIKKKLQLREIEGLTKTHLYASGECY